MRKMQRRRKTLMARRRKTLMVKVKMI